MSVVRATEVALLLKVVLGAMGAHSLPPKSMSAVSTALAVGTAWVMPSWLVLPLTRAANQNRLPTFLIW